MLFIKGKITPYTNCYTIYCSTPEASYRNLSYSDTLGEANYNVCHLVFPGGGQKMSSLSHGLLLQWCLSGSPIVLKDSLLDVQYLKVGGIELSFYIIWLLCLSENVLAL